MSLPIEEDLLRLRKGRGVLADDLPARLGVALAAACGVDDGDDRATTRRKVTQGLQEAIQRLPQDLRLVARAQFALAPEPIDRFLKDRLARAGDRLGRDERTVRRYADNAVRLLAEELPDTARARLPAVGQPGDWRIEAFNAVFRLDGPAVDGYELRRIVAVGTPLTHVDATISVPRQPGDDSPIVDVTMELIYGGRIVRHEYIGDRHLSWRIELPRPLPVHGSTEFGLHYVMPPDLPMAPHYVFVPLHPCRLFRLVVRFPPDATPATVHRLDGHPVRVLNDRAAVGEMVIPDRFGELVLTFTDLRPGLTYGARWQSG